MHDEVFTFDPGFDPSEMFIERAHRVGSLKSDGYKDRPEPKCSVIVQFRDFNDTEFVMEQAYRLSGWVFSLNRDYPKEIATAQNVRTRWKRGAESDWGC